MKAVALVEETGLADVAVERPTPGERDLLIRVHAVAANPVDMIQRAGEKGSPPRIIGWDVAGTVERVGPGCTLFKPGDDVYYAGDVTRAGGNSEYHVVDERIVGKKPSTLTFAEAAALPLTSLTAWEGLFEQLGIEKPTIDMLNRDKQPGGVPGNNGKTILIVGAAGGVGSIATQLANKAGLTVIGTASRSESRAWALAHGAHRVVAHGQPFLPQMKDIGVENVDYVFCLNEVHSQWENMISVLKPFGRICTILPPMGEMTFFSMADKSITWSIEAMFARSKHQTSDMIQQHKILSELADWVDIGAIRTTMNHHLSPINAKNVKDALGMLQSKRTIGKIVLEGF